MSHAKPYCPECGWQAHEHYSGKLACDRCGLHFTRDQAATKAKPKAPKPEAP